MALKYEVLSRQSIHAENIGDKSHIRFLKYILGVNKHTSNIAVLSETGRYRLFFSIIVSIIKYLHRLENNTSELLHPAYMYVVSKNQHYQPWYTSALYILKELNFDTCCPRNMTSYQLTQAVKHKLIKAFLRNWNKKRAQALPQEN